MKIFNKYKKVYLAGIGGIGVSAIARLFKHFDSEVLGGDNISSSITKDLETAGITVFYKKSANNIPDDVDLFIYTSALSDNHIEKLRAKELDIDMFSYPEFLGELSKEYKTIAVSGTHGKSSTTTMLGLILSEAGLDPTVIVGSQVNEFDHNLRVGKSDLLLLEACEYRGHMLELAPKYICLTNIEEDHLDYYKDLADIEDHFDRFVQKVNKENLFLNIDNKSLFAMHEKYHGVTYAIDNPSRVQAANIFIDSGRQYFDLYIENKKVEQICLPVPGAFNVYNALAAISVAHTFGVKSEVYKKVLSEYKGCWRRFEVLGQSKYKKTATVISDYAHHPTAVKATIRAAKEFYPDRRLIVAFEPHQHNRTRELFENFISSFSGADYMIVSEIYDVEGREDTIEQAISSNDLVNEIIKRGQMTSEQIEYSPSLKATKKRIIAELKPNDVLLIMGAGDIDNIARQLV